MRVGHPPAHHPAHDLLQQVLVLHAFGQGSPEIGDDLGAGISGQWLIVDSPDVDDGAELSLFGIFRFQFGGGLRVYF